MNTYGQFKPLKFILGSRPANSGSTSSILVHHHGRTDADIHDLRDTHQRRVYGYFLDTAGRFPASIFCVLATRRRECLRW
jgi:hypothetical protein